MAHLLRYFCLTAHVVLRPGRKHTKARALRAHRSHPLMKKKTNRRSGLAPGQRVRLAIHLSRDAKRELEELRVRSLDKKGIKPTHSEIIEELIHEALSKEEIPYPLT